MEQKNGFLGTEPIGKLLWKLSLPAIAAQIVNLLYNLVDRIYIGHMPGSGDLALTGVGVCMSVIMIVSAFSAFVSSGGAPRASMAMGRGDQDEAEKILGNSFSLQILISVALTAILLLFNRPLLLAFGASENTIGFATDYMNIYRLYGTAAVAVRTKFSAPADPIHYLYFILPCCSRNQRSGKWFPISADGSDLYLRHRCIRLFCGSSLWTA